MRDIFDDETDEAAKKTEQSDFAMMFENSLGGFGKKVAVGDKVRGEILTIGKDEVFVSTGTVDDGAVLKSELRNGDGEFNYKVGDFLDLFVVQVRGGQILLSPKPTAKNLAEGIEEAYQNKLPIEGKVVEVCNGGVRVLVMGKTAFCPISQLDSRRIDDPATYLGRKFEFLITQYSERGRNIVVSRRRLLDGQKELSAATFLEHYKVGDVLGGVVTRIEKFGAFMEIAPGLEALCHVSELAWSRIENPAEVVSLGQELTVKILKIEEGSGRLQVSVSAKQAQDAPWDHLPAELKIGSVVSGKVTRCMKFGAFVELAPGIEGLIPLSEMSYAKRVVHSDDLIKEGEKISVMIKEIRSDEQRMVLSLRDAMGSDPWISAADRFGVGSVLRGKVERREPYGLFVRLDDGVTALLPKSKATDNPEFSYDKAKVGDEITVQIDEVRETDRKISLKVPLDPEAGSWQGFSASGQSKVKSIGTLADQFAGLFSAPPVGRAPTNKAD